MVTQRDEVVQASVPSFAIVCVVARKNIELWADGDVVNVAGVECVVFQFSAVGSHPDHTAAAQMKRVAIAALGLDVAVVADSQIQPAIDSHAYAVGGVIRAAEAQVETHAGDKLHLLVGNTVVIPVAERGEERRINHIQCVVDKTARARAVDVRHVIGELVRHTIAVSVDALDDLTAVSLLIERTIQVDADVDVAIAAGGDAGGVGDLRRLGESDDLVAFLQGVGGLTQVEHGQ